jgi:KDO2-lipid IV(A) lauroyltransferase
VVADDSSFPEMFDLLRRQRESWGVKVIPWRNLREIYTVLRRGEMLALLVDWGYRPDGVPVRLFDAWTTLPAGPATLAAKTSSWVLPVVIRRAGPDRFHLSWTEPIAARSSDGPELLRVTQEIARALEHTIGSAPEQWYNFKPIWPATPEESAELEARAAAIRAGAERAADGPGMDPRPVAATPAASRGDGPAAGETAASTGARSTADE